MARDSPKTAPSIVQRDYPLDRMATVRTGGAAEYFARAGSGAQLKELLAWAKTIDAQVHVVGSGSNLLIADEGVAGLVVKLDRKLALIKHEGERLMCGGGARLPSVAARSAQAGLTGIEFGVNIPGTVGGAVRMNANAYGGELAKVLEWVEVVTAEGSARRTPAELGFGYRRSNLTAGEIVARASFVLTPARTATVKATLAEMRERRHAAQPQGIKTFGSTFKNPDGWVGPTEAGGDSPSAPIPPSASIPVSASKGRSAGLLLAEAGCNGLTIGGARFAEKHANFIENTGSATTADVIAVMAEGRRRVEERFGVQLEPEVQTLGDVRFPWATPRGSNSSGVLTAE
jgi:UDP-N-acetylenolpyruvoylglucosamine reductase